MKTKKEHDLFEYLEKYMNDAVKGKRVQKNGKRIAPATIQNYETLHKLLSKFSSKKKFPLRLRSADTLSKRDLKFEKNYWKKFYKQFTGYMYDECDYNDNYVGSQIKILRSFFIYLSTEMIINMANFHKLFYARNEPKQILVLTPERLNYLIYGKDFEHKLTEDLKFIRDLLIFGCTVALRISDILKISPHDFERVNDTMYLRIMSQKTQTFTRVRLPKYVIDIVDRYITTKNQRTLFPFIWTGKLNIQIKELLQIMGFTETFECIRYKRGVPTIKYKNKAKKIHFRFCDLASSHMMRRTAITTMLSLGMDEDVVRNISGHAPNSKEFYRYINYSQAYLDDTIDQVYKRLENRKLISPTK